METNSANFMPTFDCSYFIVIEDAFGCSDTSDIYLFGANASRIGSVESYPNPTNGKVTVEFDNDYNQFVRFRLVNGNGNSIEEFITKENKMNIDISKYPSGTYYLNFDSRNAEQGCNKQERQIISKKIILNK